MNVLKEFILDRFKDIKEEDLEICIRIPEDSICPITSVFLSGHLIIEMTHSVLYRKFDDRTKAKIISDISNSTLYTLYKLGL